MKKLLFGVWFIGTIFLLVEGYYIIINAVPYGLKIVSNVVSDNNGMQGEIYQRLLLEVIHSYQIAGLVLAVIGGISMCISLCTIRSNL